MLGGALYAGRHQALVFLHPPTRRGRHLLRARVPLPSARPPAGERTRPRPREEARLRRRRPLYAGGAHGPAGPTMGRVRVPLALGEDHRAVRRRRRADGRLCGVGDLRGRGDGGDPAVDAAAAAVVFSSATMFFALGGIFAAVYYLPEWFQVLRGAINRILDPLGRLCRLSSCASACSTPP